MLDSIIDNPGQQIIGDGMNYESTQSVDPFTDQLVLIIASAVGVIVLVGYFITCICCGKTNNHSRYRNTSSSDSLRDTVQLEDLLSKPTLADPESVFSEFLLDARISEDTSSQTAATVDETTQPSAMSSRSSSVVENVEESKGKHIDSNKKGSKNYRKESRKRSNVEFNNSNNNNSTNSGGNHNKSIYKKNSSNTQTLQNDLAYVSSKRKKIQNKLEHYNKKATESLQQHESGYKEEKSMNVRKEKEMEMDENRETIKPSSSLEVVDNMNRYSSGSENNMSITSLARGSVCHDIGAPAHAFRLQRLSIYPRMDSGSRGDGRREGTDDEVCSLPNVIESPVDSPNATIDYPDEAANSANDLTKSDNAEGHAKAEEHYSKEQDANITGTVCQDEHTRDVCPGISNSSKTKCLQKTYSVDRTFNDQDHRRKLPDRISLNLQIDFHFHNNEGQPQGEGPIPIVVCSPIAFNNESREQKTESSPILKPDSGRKDTELNTDTIPLQDDNQQDKLQETKGTKQCSNTHECALSNYSESAEEDSGKMLRKTNLHTTSRIPFWVKNRLSEPAELYNWVEKVSNSPRLSRRSFTVADFKSFKLKSFTNIYDEDSSLRPKKVRNTTNSQEQTEEIDSNLKVDPDTEPSGESSEVQTTVDTSCCQNKESVHKQEPYLSPELSNRDDKMEVQNIALTATPSEINKDEDSGKLKTISNKNDIEDAKSKYEHPTSSTSVFRNAKSAKEDIESESDGIDDAKPAGGNLTPDISNLDDAKLTEELPTSTILKLDDQKLAEEHLTPNAADLNDPGFIEEHTTAHSEDANGSERVKEQNVLNTKSYDFEDSASEIIGNDINTEQDRGDSLTEVEPCDESDEDREHYVENDIVLRRNRNEAEMAEHVADVMGNEKSSNEGTPRLSCCDDPENQARQESNHSESCETDNSKSEEDQQQIADRSSMSRPKSSSLGFLPSIPPSVPSLIVTTTEGEDIGYSQTFPKAASRQAPTTNNVIPPDCAAESDCSMARGVNTSSVEDSVDCDDYLSDDVIMSDHDQEIININRHETPPQTTTQVNMTTSSRVADNVSPEVNLRHNYPRAPRPKSKSVDHTPDERFMRRRYNIQRQAPTTIRPKSKSIDHTTDEIMMEMDFSQTYPKSQSQKSKSMINYRNDDDDFMEINTTTTGLQKPDYQIKSTLCENTATYNDSIGEGEGCSGQQNYPPSSANTTKENSANTTLDTNAGSDDSDYDNPWDSLENAVKRASMKYHKRPSVAASSVRDLMLKSAEDLGRLIEIAEKRRRDRLHSTKSTCHDLETTDNNPPPVFTRVSPLRHTVKGVMSSSSRGSNEDLGGLGRSGGKPSRGKAGSKSLRASKDDSVHHMKAAEEDTKASRRSGSKSWKFYSPESKKKLKK